LEGIFADIYFLGFNWSVFPINPVQETIQRGETRTTFEVFFTIASKLSPIGFKASDIGRSEFPSPGGPVALAVVHRGTCPRGRCALAIDDTYPPSNLSPIHDAGMRRLSRVPKRCTLPFHISQRDRQGPQARCDAK
jgi:hypothetical protein